MQFLDFQVILLITPIIGYLAGFMTIKINYLLVIALGKLWSSGHAKKRFIPIGIVAAACYIIVVMVIFDFTTLTDPIFQTAGPVILTIVFSGLYVAGIYHADMRFKDAITIMNIIIQITYAKGESPVEKKIREDTKKNARAVLEAMPESNNHALRLLLFVFDSATMVFLISLSGGRFRASRFIDLDSGEQEEYFQTWANNPYLYYAVQALKSLIGFSYYTSAGTWKDIGYSGTLLGRSYWK